MEQIVSLSDKKYSRVPRGVSFIRSVFSALDKVFDWFYSSKYNPLYRSGVLAVSLLSLVIVTGVYLLLFYRLSAPYESIVGLQNQVWLGRWVRALHRYASDAALIVVIYHFLRMMAEGRSWGPRFLAWLSGTILFGMIFISGWTGFILVWDLHGQVLAQEGAKIIDLLPVLPDSISRSFSGATSLGSSFFFMNLFLHVAVPLGMTLGLWIHTSRLARPKWFPQRREFLYLLTALLFLSLLWPAPLPEAADLLKVEGTYKLDFFYGFWLHWKNSPLVLGVSWVLGFLLLFSVPLWWRPREPEKPGVSIHDEEKCTGCTQCAQDCPFEAIEMVPRTKGEGSKEVAHVFDNLCVGCGICAGSCTQFAIGPQGRSGRDQLAKIKSLVTQIEKNFSGVALISCHNNTLSRRVLKHLNATYPNLHQINVDCIGGVHTGVVTLLLTRYQKVLLSACPPEKCQSREGVELEQWRLFENRSPGLPKNINLDRVTFLKPERPGRFNRYFRSVFATALLLTVLGAGSGIDSGSDPKSAYLRLSFRLPGQIVEVCRDYTEAELKSIPLHMRRKQNCTNHKLAYDFNLEIDGASKISKVIDPKGARGDRPLVIEEQLALSEGKHSIKITLAPKMPEVGAVHASSFRHQSTRIFKLGRAELITLDQL